MTETNLLNVTLYTRDDCGLCDEVKKHLNGLQKKFPHRLVEVNIDSDPTLKQSFALEIPVVEIGPYKLKAPISKQSLEMTLGAASDRRSQFQQVDSDTYQKRLIKGQTVSQSDRIYFWISRHYLALLNLLMFVYAGLPFLAPTLMEVNATAPARLIYAMYSPLCHQFGFRSFFLFGEQPYYPLKEAGLTGIKTFDQITGLQDLSNPYSVSRLGARQFVGNPAVGFKVALCERDIAIYGAIFIFGLIYGLAKRKLPPLHWTLWILIGLGPIGLDGFSQLFSQFNWPWLAAYLPYRESTPFLRVFTGFVFGFMTAWFAYPNIEESMQETRQFFIKKFAAAKP
ncbi:MAG: DUF2085 domain-containing protein [Chloroflexi bacterium]|nr:DUF2085 domain-containing protein [Chloroflexota bacterium]